MTLDSQEQNQRTMRAIVLCVLVAVVYTQVFLNKGKKAAPLPPANTAQIQSNTTAGQPVTSQAPAPQAQVAAPLVSAQGSPQVSPAVVSAAKHPDRASVEKSSTTTIESSVSILAITHLGARVSHLRLADYKLSLGAQEALDMVDTPDGGALPMGVTAGLESDDFVQYSLSSVNGKPVTNEVSAFKLDPSAELVLDFRGMLPSGNGITKRFKFKEGAYLFNVDVMLDQKLPEGQSVWIEWAHFFSASDTNPRLKMTHVTYLDGTNKIRQVAMADLQEGLRDFGTSIWASLGDMYFMATVVPSVGGRNTLLGREGSVYAARVAGTNTGGAFRVYVGPKDYKTLKYVGDSLERAIDLGWFAFLAYPLLWFLHYLYLALGNYGLAIIALTLIVKTALLPLSKAGFESMKKMQDLQPEMKALRERITDANQLNQEMLALYQRRGVNPMGGCLPLIIQIPVFLGLYQALLNSIELRHSPFALWIKDLSAPEHLDIFGVPVPVMVLLMSASMLVQQWTTPMPTADPVQKKVMTMMPIMFAVMFIIFPMPAGLVLYWLVNNTISIVQQVYMRSAKKGASVYTATAVTSALVFGFGWLLTLI